MPKIVIDGMEIEAAASETILQAALLSGIHIPHFCFHPNLKIAGNCRMCLVEIEKVPKLQVSCGTPVKEGMVVHTENERVKHAREAIMELLLINHPLDCPICDQSGECTLQDHSFAYGTAKSRYAEKKRVNPELNIGPDIKRNQNRCIHCTRCIRFLRDVAAMEELGLSERGNHTVVGTYFEQAIESPFSMNTIDICPVGALTSKHFRFKARSWLMQRTRTVCADCGRGCNATAWVYKGCLLRLTPERNDAVNVTWLCNRGRLSVNRVAAFNRILCASHRGNPVDADAALDKAAVKLKEMMAAGAGDKVGIIASSHLMNEDAFVLGKLTDTLGTRKLCLVSGAADPRPFGPIDAPLPEWFVRQDATPNSRGTRDMLGTTVDLAAMVAAVTAGEIKALLVFGANPAAEDNHAVTALAKLDLLVAALSHENDTTAMASIVWPEATAFEKEGTFRNEAGRLQRVRAALPPRGESRSTWQWASSLAKRLGADWSFASAAAVCDAIAANVPGYSGVSWHTIPEEGVPLK